MSQLSLDFPAPRPTLSLWRSPSPAEPPSAAVVAAVLAFGDQREEREDGAVLIRFSRPRLEREDMGLLLGEDRPRALDVSVIWDNREDEIVRVLDLAPLGGPRGAGATTNRYADARLRGCPPRQRASAPEAAEAAEPTRLQTNTGSLARAG